MIDDRSISSRCFHLSLSLVTCEFLFPYALAVRERGRKIPLRDELFLGTPSICYLQRRRIRSSQQNYPGTGRREEGKSLRPLLLFI